MRTGLPFAIAIALFTAAVEAQAPAPAPAIKRREEVEAFLMGGLSPVPGAYARTVKFMVPHAG